MDDNSKPAQLTLEQPEQPRKANKLLKTRRGYGRKNERRNKNGSKDENFSLLGTNAAGLNSKLESFYSSINNFQPSVITIQETKFSKAGRIKIPGYQIFERVRTNKKGGGLLTAAVDNINPVLISIGKDENEIMTIQVDIGCHRIRIINAYGPQEDHSTQKVLGFWQELEAEVMNPQ